MKDIMMLTYTNGNLDRATELRKNPEWISKQLKSTNATIIPIWNDCNLIDKEDTNLNPTAIFYSGQKAKDLLDLSSEIVFFRYSK